MLGFGFGEILLIGLMLVVGLSALVGYDFLKKGVRQGRSQDFEGRVLDELEVLRLRMDSINDRLDRLEPSPPIENTLPSSDADQEVV